MKKFILFFCLLGVLHSTVAGAAEFQLRQMANLNLNGSSDPRFFRVVDDRLYFTATDNVDSDGALFSYDGERVTKVAEAGASSDCVGSLNGELYFTNSDGFLVKVRDTEITTLSGVATGTHGGACSPLITVGDNLYFRGFRDDFNNYGLYRSDGAIVERVANAPSAMIAFGDHLVFHDGSSLWKTDGKSLEQINEPGQGLTNYGGMTEFEGKVFFEASGIDGPSLYQTNGQFITSVGSLFSDADSTTAHDFVALKGELYFAAESRGAEQLYKFNGSEVTAIAGVPVDAVFSMTTFNDELYLAGSPLDTDWIALFSTDGKTFRRLTERWLMTQTQFIDLGSLLLFDAIGPIADGVYSTDGLSVNFAAKIDLYPNGRGPDYAAYKGRLIVSAADSNGDRELYSLQAVPEPSSTLLYACGVLALMFRIRCRTV